MNIRYKQLTHIKQIQLVKANCEVL